MPLYEYQCDVCATRFERIQKFSDPPIETCPSCEGAVRKLVSSPAIQFKGAGWYITDYARKGAAKDKGDSAKDSKDGASKSESSAGSAGDSSSSSSSSASDSASGATKTTAAGGPSSGS